MKEECFFLQLNIITDCKYFSCLLELFHQSNWNYFFYEKKVNINLQYERRLKKTQKKSFRFNHPIFYQQKSRFSIKSFVRQFYKREKKTFRWKNIFTHQEFFITFTITFLIYRSWNYYRSYFININQHDLHVTIPTTQVIEYSTHVQVFIIK